MRTATLSLLVLTSCRAAPAALPTQTVLLHEEGVENAHPRLSSDGRRVVYQSNRTGHWQLWAMDTETREQTRLTNDRHENNFVDLSADAEWVVFVSDRDGNEEIYRMRIDGTALERLTDDPARDIHPYFAPDGASLLFNSTRGNGSLDLYRLHDEVLTAAAPDEEHGRAVASRDGRSLVFNKRKGDAIDIVALALR